MLYTIGKKSLYDAYIRDDPRPQKRGRRSELNINNEEGGSVWKDYESAKDAAKISSQISGDEFVVYGVEADWDLDTASIEGARFRELLVDSDLFVLPQYIAVLSESIILDMKRLAKIEIE